MGFYNIIKGLFSQFNIISKKYGLPFDCQGQNTCIYW